MFVLLSLLLPPLQRVVYALLALAQPPRVSTPERGACVVPKPVGPVVATRTAVPTASLAFVHTPAPRLLP
ncbi:hypothetical protein AZ34_06670 [Hylemonella gracilis str. Niagara R]|uniref:Uncharacterized protein n=1 Tax=Hylemonella gracilis str. Niagara R TaxID=1458275 RepID=A0A016XMK9_9BURK|nr:hypothetical protein [Hylemonella gracilis]EYC52822.1 hypothetical protein AZ34_06670 [Hylemonella gracilis str. Niagara R]